MISAVTAHLLRGACLRSSGLGLEVLRGVAEPLRLLRGWCGNARWRSAKRGGGRAGGRGLAGRDAETAVAAGPPGAEQRRPGAGGVLISGEGGIGRSRLVEALRAQILHDGHIRMTFRCSPYHTNSAFLSDHYPSGAGAAVRDETPDGKFARLEQVLGTYRFPRADTLPLLATAPWSSPARARAALARVLPAQQKQRDPGSDLIAWMVEEAERQPVLAVWEKIQWIDPSSLEALGLVGGAGAHGADAHGHDVSARSLQPPWGTRAYLTTMDAGQPGGGAGGGDRHRRGWRQDAAGRHPGANRGRKPMACQSSWRK